jgi:hypothetical protein
MRRIDRHLIVGPVAVLDAEVEVLQVDVEVGQNRLILDETLDDAGHLVAVGLHDGGLHLDLRHPVLALSSEPGPPCPAAPARRRPFASARGRSKRPGQTLQDPVRPIA